MVGDAEEKAVPSESSSQQAMDVSTRSSRRRPKREATSFQVHFPVPSTFRATVSRDWIIRLSTEALWKHLLYSRGVVALPIHQILVEQSSMDRKMKRVRDALLTLSADWKLIAHSSLDIRYVLLQLGPSWTRPKEIYLIDFTRVELDDNAEMFEILPSKEYTLSTRWIREVVTAECQADSSLSSKEVLSNIQRASGDQLLVGIGVTESSLEELYSKEGVQVEAIETMSDEAPVLHKLTVRRDFTIDWNKRGVQRTAQLQLSSTSSNDDPCVEQTGMQDVVWLSLRSAVKGFRLPTTKSSTYSSF